MNLIELFESKPFQDVGTFNSIFTSSPILNVAVAAEVTIKELTPQGRRLLVGGETIFLDLHVYRQKKIRAAKMPYVRRGKKGDGTLPSVYKQLTPSEFMIFSALQKLGEISSHGELSRLINLTRRSIGSNLASLVKKGLVRKKDSGFSLTGNDI